MGTINPSSLARAVNERFRSPNIPKIARSFRGRINDRCGRCSIGFGLFPSDVRAFKGHAAFHRVPEKWEF